MRIDMYDDSHDEPAAAKTKHFNCHQMSFSLSMWRHPCLLSSADGTEFLTVFEKQFLRNPRNLNPQKTEVNDVGVNLTRFSCSIGNRYFSFLGIGNCASRVGPKKRPSHDADGHVITLHGLMIYWAISSNALMYMIMYTHAPFIDIIWANE